MQSIKEIEEEIFRITCDTNAVFGHTDHALRIFNDEVELQQIPEELAHVLWNLVGLTNEKKYPNVLEVGIASGYSVLSFDHFLDVDSFTLIDDGKHRHFLDIEEVLFDIDYHIFIGDSTSEYAVDFAKQRGPFDLIHIDANHSYDYVSQDFKNYSEFLSENGVIVLHDSLHQEGPRRVLIEAYRLEHRGFKVLCNIGNKFGSAIMSRSRV